MKSKKTSGQRIALFIVVAFEFFVARYKRIFLFFSWSCIW